jgi:hypothetical protein
MILAELFSSASKTATEYVIAVVPRNGGSPIGFYDGDGKPLAKDAKLARRFKSREGARFEADKKADKICRDGQDLKIQPVPVLKEWSGDVETKKHPPEGLFATGTATAIVKWLKASHKDLKGAMSALNFYINRAGKNLTADRKGELEAVKTKLRSVFGVQEDLELSERMMPKVDKFMKSQKAQALVKAGMAPEEMEEFLSDVWDEGYSEGSKNKKGC